MPNCKSTAQSLSEWFSSPQGGYVLARERAYFDRTVTGIFGYNALQLGLSEHDFLRGNRMPLRIIGGNQARKLCGHDTVWRSLLVRECPHRTSSRNRLATPVTCRRCA